MRKILIFPLLALAGIASAVNPTVTLDSYNDTLTYDAGTNTWTGLITGTVTAGTNNVVGVSLAGTASDFTPGSLARFTWENNTNYSFASPLPAGQSFTGLLATVHFSGNGAAKGKIEIIATDSTLTSGISPEVTIQTAPEPSTWAALCLGSLAMLRRRRR